jgi:hypothetical protein
LVGDYWDECVWVKVEWEHMKGMFYWVLN